MPIAVKHVFDYEGATRYLMAVIFPPVRDGAEEEQEFTRHVLSWTKSTSLEDMKKDFHRTAFFRSTDVQSFLEPWQSTLDEVPLPYTQGDWIGGAFGPGVISHINVKQWHIKEEEEREGSEPGLVCTLSFGYFSNNQQTRSGIMIFWLKQRPDIWMISILKDPEKVEELKAEESKGKESFWHRRSEVTVFCSNACENIIKSHDKTLIQKNAHADTDGTVRYYRNSTLLKDIQETIDSPEVSDSLGAVISNGVIHEDHLRTTALTLSTTTKELKTTRSLPRHANITIQDEWTCCSTNEEQRHWLNQFYLAGFLKNEKNEPDEKLQNQYLLQAVNQLSDELLKNAEAAPILPLTLTEQQIQFITEQKAFLLKKLHQLQKSLRAQADHEHLVVCQFLESILDRPKKTYHVILVDPSAINALYHLNWPWRKEWWRDRNTPEWKKWGVILCAVVIIFVLTFFTAGIFVGFGIFAGIVAGAVGVGIGALGCGIKYGLDNKISTSANNMEGIEEWEQQFDEQEDRSGRGVEYIQDQLQNSPVLGTTVNPSSTDIERVTPDFQQAWDTHNVHGEDKQDTSSVPSSRQPLSHMRRGGS